MTDCARSSALESPTEQHLRDLPGHAGRTHLLRERRLTVDDRVFLLHIPKTAGTTLNIFLLNHFDRRHTSPFYFSRSAAARDRNIRDFKYIRGHVPYDVIRDLTGPDLSCITMLRSPVERFLSSFAHLQRLNGMRWKQLIDVDSFRSLKLEEAVRDSDMVSNTVGINAQVFFIAGRLNVRGLDELDPENRLQIRSIEPRELELARTRLDEFVHVGLVERFQESLFLLCYTFGWRPVLRLQPVNVAPRRPRRDRLSEETLEAVRAFNTLDLQLYDHAKQLFEARYAEMTEELLSRYGDREHASLSRPLPAGVVYELLQRHHERRSPGAQRPTRSSRIDFNRAVPGSAWSGWYYPHQTGLHGTVRWTGPGIIAMLDLPLAADHELRIRFRVVLAAAPDIFRSLTLRVNDESVALYGRLDWCWATILEGWIPPWVLGKGRGVTRLAFGVNRTVSVRTLQPQDDWRELGLAFNWIEIEPASKPALLLLRLMGWYSPALRWLGGVRTVRTQVRIKRLLRLLSRRSESIRRSRA